MGMNLDSPIFLQRNGFLTASKNRILDIGPQTLYNATLFQISEFITNQTKTANISHLSEKIERLSYFSTPRPGERTTMFSEVTDLTNIEYASIDVCPGLRNTEILDLNFESLPDRMKSHFDVVFNFGTTEHIVDQWNCFEVIHDALKVGGTFYHQLPASGYLDHGYFCYTPLFFRELAQANGYKIEHLAVTHAGENRIDDMGILSMAGETLTTPPAHLDVNNRIPALNIHVIGQRTSDADFKAPLEIATSHSPLHKRMMKRYAGRVSATSPGRFRRLIQAFKA